MSSAGPPSRHAGWWWVALQVVLLLALVFVPSSPSLHAPLLAGWVLFGAGLAVFAAAFIALGNAFTPNPMPKPDAALAVHGIYRLIRHPMYSAVLLCSLGWAAAFGGVWHYVLCAALLIFFWAKSRTEERWLAQRYADYAQYQRTVGRFVPRLRRLR
ncbi:MAG: methyltransferase family protein [Burkholderiaceae bacterium]